MKIKPVGRSLVTDSPKPAIKFDLPTEIELFAKREGISLSALRKGIETSLWEGALDKDFNSIKGIKKIRVVINGLSNPKNKSRIYISPKSISEKKPFAESSWASYDYSTYYLIYKN